MDYRKIERRICLTLMIRSVSPLICRGFFSWTGWSNPVLIFAEQKGTFPLDNRQSSSFNEISMEIFIDWKSVLNRTFSLQSGRSMRWFSTVHRERLREEKISIHEIESDIPWGTIPPDDSQYHDSLFGTHRPFDPSFESQVKEQKTFRIIVHR